MSESRYDPKDETRAVAGSQSPEPPPSVVPLPGEPPQDLFPAEIGDFQLQEHLGQGGMGVVFLAVQKSLGRQVALKLIKPGQASSPEARHILFREARAASRLDHPGICPIYEIGEAEGIPFLAMRFLEGETLAERIRVARVDAPPVETGRRPAPAGPDRKEALALIQLLE
ncbi:MAG: protein kinase, partial [Thermoleophilia bacterium]|nr:protein kinase [Thermoleophilia bacterium]